MNARAPARRWMALTAALIASVLLAAATAAAARAGQYHITSCMGGILPANLLHVDEVANMHTARACGDGFNNFYVTQSGRYPAEVPLYSGATWRYSPPPGTTLAALAYKVDSAGFPQKSTWNAGVWGINAGGAGIARETYPESPIAPAVRLGVHYVALRPGDRALAIGIFCVTAPSCATERGRAWLNFSDVSVAINVPHPAVVQLGGRLVWGGWISGPQQLAYDATDAAGIRLAIGVIDGKVAPGDTATYACNFTIGGKPCSDVHGGHLPVDTRSLADGPHRGVLQIYDAGGNLTKAPFSFRVDNTPPTAATGLHAAGGSGWRRSNDFELGWTDPDQGAGSPIAAATYVICPASNPSGDATGCINHRVTGHSINHISGIKVPHSGAWTASVILEDAAGHVGLKSPSAPVTLRFDDQAPHASFALPNPSDPQAVAVNVADDASGVAGGQIEISRSPNGAWVPVTTRLAGSQLVGHLDGSKLADGWYGLCAIVKDHAGNVTITGRRTNGRLALIHAPLRALSHLTAGFAREKTITKKAHPRGKHGRAHHHSRRAHRHRHVGRGHHRKRRRAHTRARRRTVVSGASRDRRAHRPRRGRRHGRKHHRQRRARHHRHRKARNNTRRARVLAQRIHARWKHKITLSGRLTAAGSGQPLIARTITIYAKARATGTSALPVGTATSDQNGHWHYATTARYSTAYTASYAGENLIRGSKAEAAVTVRSPVRLHLSPKQLLNGQAERLSGRVLGGYIPPGGIGVDLQYYTPPKTIGWRSFGYHLQTDAKGRFATRYPFLDERGIHRFKLRAHADYSAARPFAAGHSKPREFTVIGKRSK